jgi:phosphopantothenoylcysteine decarboxylase/phosphopantothenate--cysteine ligase
LGKEKKFHQIHVGFALETENEVFHAKQKLNKKNFDLIVLNSMREKGAGFQLDTNKVSLFFEDGSSVQSEVMPKEEIANLILEGIKKLPVKI